PYAMAETTIRLRPRSEWPKVGRVRWYSSWAPEPLRRILRHVWPDLTPRTNAELVEELDRAVRLPGWTAAWTRPARARMDMMATNIRTPIGIRIVSPDPERLDVVGTALRALVERVPGTRSAVFESLGGETWVDFAADPEAMRRLGVDPAAAHDVAELLTTTGVIGEIEHQGRRLRVRRAPDVPDVAARAPTDNLRDATVRSSTAPAAANGSTQPVPL